MTINERIEFLKELGVNARKLALETCTFKEIEPARHILDIDLSLEDGETITVCFGARWEGDGYPEMSININDVISSEATEAAIDRETNAYQAKQEEKRLAAEARQKQRDERIEAEEKQELERLKKKYPVNAAS